MAKLGAELERMLKAMDIDLTESQKEKNLKMLKVEAPDEMTSFIDEFENSNLITFKSKIKRSVLDAEDANISELEDVIGKERIDKIRGANGVQKVQLLKKAFNDVVSEKVAAEKALKVASKEGDSEEIKIAQQKIIALEGIEGNFNTMKVEFEALKTEKTGLESQLSDAKTAIFNSKVDMILSKSNDLQTVFKESEGLELSRMKFNNYLKSKDYTLDIENDRVLNKSGNPVIEGGANLNISKATKNFIEANPNLKKMAEAQQTTASTVQNVGQQQKEVAELTPEQLKLKQYMDSRLKTAQD